jgi:hypothetical protein
VKATSDQRPATSDQRRATCKIPSQKTCQLSKTFAPNPPPPVKLSCKLASCTFLFLDFRTIRACRVGGRRRIDDRRMAAETPVEDGLLGSKKVVRFLGELAGR